MVEQEPDVFETIELLPDKMFEVHKHINMEDVYGVINNLTSLNVRKTISGMEEIDVKAFIAIERVLEKASVVSLRFYFCLGSYMKCHLKTAILNLRTTCKYI